MAVPGLYLDPPLEVGEGVPLHAYQIFLGKWGRGDFAGQRFGQAFSNFFRITPSDVERTLYYTQTVETAKSLISQYFLKED